MGSRARLSARALRASSPMPASWAFSFPKSTAARAPTHVSYALAIEELAARRRRNGGDRFGAFDDLLGNSASSGRKRQQRALASGARGGRRASPGLRLPNRMRDRMRPPSARRRNALRRRIRSRGPQAVVHAAEAMPASSWGCFAPAVRERRGVSAFLIETNLPGITIEARDREARHSYEQHVRPRFRRRRGCRDDALLGEEGVGLRQRDDRAYGGTHRHRRAGDRHPRRLSRRIGEVRKRALRLR